MKYHLFTLLSTLLLACGSTHESVSLEQKAAKMLIVGVQGTSLSEGSSIVEDIRSGISGVILFEANIAKPDVVEDPRGQLAQFVGDLKSVRREPLFVAIDQEGGFVNRLKPKYGFERMPSQRSVAEAGGDKPREVAAVIAREVASVGINLNFSPCVDVDINPACPAIGRFERSFSADEQVVSDLSQVYIAEHHKQGVLTSIKHFPGHGSSLVDSHLGLTDITDTWQKERELKPYEDIIASGECDMVMVSHLFNSKIDPNYPATLSRPTIDSLLRGVMGWSGVVISDDMQMKAIVDNYGFEEAVKLGVNAGVDLFIVGGNIRRDNYSVRERFVETIKSAVESGEIKMERIDESVARIDKMLQRLR